MKYYIEGKEVRLIDLCKANEIKLVNEFETMADILLEENAKCNMEYRERSKRL